VAEQRIGILGATSLVGAALVGSGRIAGFSITAVSRTIRDGSTASIQWIAPGEISEVVRGAHGIRYWISLIPIWVLPEYFEKLGSGQLVRVVALSSTSQFSKQESPEATERAIAGRLVDGEARLKKWAEGSGIEWVVLRPTLIYGRGADRNVREIARFIRRFRIFPLLGAGTGRRQPIHADDVAAACVAALRSTAAVNRAYAICGGETLTYREMVARIFAALGRRPTFVRVPLSAFRIAIAFARLLPRYRSWTAAMAERMNRDLEFDGSEAVRDLGVVPRPFKLDAEDLAA